MPKLKATKCPFCKGKLEPITVSDDYKEFECSKCGTEWELDKKTNVLSRARG